MSTTMPLVPAPLSSSLLVPLHPFCRSPSLPSHMLHMLHMLRMPAPSHSLVSRGLLRPRAVHAASSTVSDVASFTQTTLRACVPNPHVLLQLPKAPALNAYVTHAGSEPGNQWEPSHFITFQSGSQTDRKTCKEKRKKEKKRRRTKMKHTIM